MPDSTPTSRLETGARFRIRARQLSDGHVRHFTYDNGVNTITDEAGNPIPVPPGLRRFDSPRPSAHSFSPDDPIRKVAKVEVLKISMGLSCNYSCDYCSQRFVPHADETSAKNVPAFLDMIERHLDGAPRKVEFWGGEPFVYWKTFRPLAEALRVKWPMTQFSVITNGSLLDFEKNEWLDRMGFAVAVSHDGPGQHVRGPDPLDDPERREAILGLYRRLAPQGRMSFNAMLNSQNLSRGAIQQFFIQLTGDPNVPIGEGAVISPYDEGGLANSISGEAAIALRRNAFNDIRTGADSNFGITRSRIEGWLRAFTTNRPASSLAASCGMDNPGILAVDLKGNVLSCQNVSIEGVAPNGESHAAGHLSDLGAVAVKTMTHWSHREGCRSCPVLQSCSGTCAFLEGELRWRGCDNSYNDNIAHFAAALEMVTGYLPEYIEPLDGELPEYRRELWHVVEKPKCIIPIKAAVPQPPVSEVKALPPATPPVVQAPQTWDSLEDFARWYLAAGMPVLPPAGAQPVRTEDASALCLFRKGQFQVELYLLDRANGVLAHAHPGVEVLQMALAMPDRGWGAFWPVLKEGDTHGQAAPDHPVVQPETGAMLAFQRWKEGVLPSTVAAAWRGPTVGPQHEEIIRRHFPKAHIQDGYGDVSRSAE